MDIPLTHTHLVHITTSTPHVCETERRKEIKEGGDGQMEELSEGCSSVLVNSHVCFHESESTDDVTQTICVEATSAWCLCVCVCVCKSLQQRERRP